MVSRKGALDSISVVEAIIKDKSGKILLLKRSKNNHYYLGKWQLPGGKVEFGEDIQKAIKREIYEETGIKYFGIQLGKVFSLKSIFDGKKSNVFLMVFEGELKGKIILSNEHSQAKFVSMNSIKKASLCPLSKKALFG
ncbi:MAG: NUDIX domain-containing protein [Candidatus Diapherotrites archaeon]|jgi:8-oxo-dGTP diphosphatase|uniref:NUDIX domain-containing protein n=1 Tax=Candidatus Iainarchaeum sp. TaxID=3101447 RepID=A0A8T5GFX4_9ARCH|nr:NUDIX domain-containing protein [Candidatus Diapherotrites archaeon]MBT7241376.1 NUDIX domain-containing protein [Candidatus Diapherotrites archaeon]